MRINSRKLIGFALSALLLAALSACAGTDGDDTEKIDLSDALGGSAIVTAVDLVEFIERGEGSTAVLDNNIDLENVMLKLTNARGNLTIEGNGFTITGNGDCVFRMEADMTLTLNNVTIVGGYDGIGALGNCTLAGKGSTIKGVASAVNCIGFLTISEYSNLTFEAQEGSGASARGITIGNNAVLNATGGMSGVISTDSGITLSEGSQLLAYTLENYNALQCARTLTLKDGSTLTVSNLGLYHGAETDTLSVEGAAVINATGGSKGAGLFIYTLDEEIRVLGNCTPEARFENGNGSITFVETPDELTTPTPEPTQTPEG